MTCKATLTKYGHMTPNVLREMDTADRDIFWEEFGITQERIDDCSEIECYVCGALVPPVRLEATVIKHLKGIGWDVFIEGDLVAIIGKSNAYPDWYTLKARNECGRGKQGAWVSLGFVGTVEQGRKDVAAYYSLHRFDGDSQSRGI
jgi:hypothetical protein